MSTPGNSCAGWIDVAADYPHPLTATAPMEPGRGDDDNGGGGDGMPEWDPDESEELDPTDPRGERVLEPV